MKNLDQTTKQKKRALDSLLPKCINKSGRLDLRRTDTKTLSFLAELIQGMSDASIYSDEILLAEVARIQKQSHWIFYGRHKKSRAFYFFRMLRQQDKGGCYILEPSGKLTHQAQTISCEIMRQLTGGNTKYMFPPSVQQLILNEQNFLGHRGDKRDIGYYFVQRQTDGGIGYRDMTCRLVVDPNNPDKVESGTGDPDCNYRGVSKRMAEIIEEWIYKNRMVRNAIPWTIPPKQPKNKPLPEIVLAETRTNGIN